MPVITLKLLKDIITKQSRPVTTNEIINHAADNSPRILENLVSNMLVLEKAGFIKKSFDKRKNSYVWEMNNPNLNERDILEKYPELYEQSLYGEESFNIKKKRE